MNSPLKFLDAYGRGDRGVFFGRDQAIEDLYTLTLQTKLVLVYGMSGTGKTSIIQCGLAAKFRDSDWLPLLIRRKDDLNAATIGALSAAARRPLPPDADLIAAIRSVYLDRLRPVFLIFDQFEEIFILGSVEERAVFFANVARLLASDLSFKIIISLREEYIAQLTSYEAVVPTLFEKRLRIEPMTPLFIKEVFNKTAGAFGIELEHPEEAPGEASTADAIVAQLTDQSGFVELANLQVYLDRLYRSAAAAGSPIRFTDDLIAQTGAISDVMVKFLNEQVDAISAALKAQHPELGPQAVDAILGEFVTAEGTKLPLSLAELARRPLRLGATALLPAEGWRAYLPWKRRATPAETPVDISAVVVEVTARLEQARILRLAGDRYELAHDCLAARVGELRTADRSAALRQKKIIRDALDRVRSGERQAYLDQGQLIGIRQFADRLDLDPDEIAFVRTSAWRAARKILFTVMGVALVILLLIIVVVVVSISLDEADVAEAKYKAANDTIMKQAERDQQKHKQLTQLVFPLIQSEPNLNKRLQLENLLAVDGPANPVALYNLAEKYIELGDTKRPARSKDYDQASKLLDTMQANLSADPTKWRQRYLYHFARGNIALGRHQDPAALDELIAAFKEAEIDPADPDPAKPLDLLLQRGVDGKKATYLAAGFCRLSEAQHRTGQPAAAALSLRKAQVIRAQWPNEINMDLREIFARCDALARP